MKIILDEREHVLYEKCQILLQLEKQSTISITKKVLPLGDILICDDNDKILLIVERKSFADMLSSIKDGRYEEQSYRLIHSSDMPPHSIIYLLEGMFSQLRFPNDKKIIYSAITSLMVFKGFSVYRTATTHETAEWLLHMTEKMGREMTKGRELWGTTITNNDVEPNVIYATIDPNAKPATTAADYCNVVKKVKKENITPENIGEIMLCQIPGVSSITAISIMQKFSGGFPHLLDELKRNPTCLENILVGAEAWKQRKISKSCVENIQRFLLAAEKEDAIIRQETEPCQP